MITYRGANLYYRPEDVPETAFKTASMLHISVYSLLQNRNADAVWRAVSFAQQIRSPSASTPAWNTALIIPDDSAVDRGCGHLYFRTQRYCAIVWHGRSTKAARYLLNEGVQLTGIKLGEEGCYLADAKAACFYRRSTLK
jgi:sugar/nucleoside kinase (ribokinase family)